MMGDGKGSGQGHGGWCLISYHIIFSFGGNEICKKFPTFEINQSVLWITVFNAGSVYINLKTYVIHRRDDVKRAS